MLLEMLTGLDGKLLLWIQEYLRNDVLTPFFIFITTLGNSGFLWIVVSAVLLVPKGTRKVGCMCLCALVLSFLFNNLFLKNFVGRARPFDTLEALVPLIRRPSDFSFPSGHTASSFAAAGVCYRKLPKKYGIPLLIMAALIGLSRLYLGVHYPSDVLFGMISGWFVGCAAEALIGLLTKRAEGEDRG